MQLTAKRLWFVLIAAVALCVMVLVACVYFATGVLKEKSKDVHDARLESAVLDREQTALTRAKADIAKYSELGQIAKSIVPQDKDQAKTVREIVNLAVRHHVKLGAITFPSSSLGSSTRPGVKGTTDAQLQPVVGLRGIYSLSIAIKSDSAASPSYGDFLDFLNALEQNRRTALVSAITITPDAKDAGKLQFALTIDEYIKP